LYLIKNIGKYFIFLGSMFVNKESYKIYSKQILTECVIIGVNSIFIVSIVSSFMGAVTFIQTSYNLTNPLISNSIIGTIIRDMTILELAPTITAIVFAGKIGSNIAAELGTMKIKEQIDALEVMGINSISYLVLPKIISTILMYPLLVIISGFLAIYGAFVVGTATNLISPENYIYGIRINFNPYTINFAIYKSLTFAFLISSISSYQGYYTKGGALEVGRSSTKAVTYSYIAILITDYLLAQILLN